MTYSRFAQPTQPKGWRESLDFIKAAEREFTQYGPIMTPYERAVIQRDITETREKLYPVISGGIIGEFEQAIQNFDGAKKSYDAAKTREINRWESGRLQTEIQSLRTRIELVAKAPTDPHWGGKTIAQKMADIYEEARASGDIYKQRAAAEVMQVLTPNVDPANGVDIIHVARAAERDGAAIRVTDEITQAEQQVNQSFNDLMAKHHELVTVAGVYGEGPFSGGSMSLESRRLQVNRETGEVKIYPVDSPEVTGFYIATEGMTND